MKKPFLLLLLLLSVSAAALLLLAVGKYSFYASPEAIRAHLLDQKPIGTSIDDIENWLRTEKRAKIEVSRNKGFWKSESGIGVGVGEMSIYAVIGEFFSFPFLKTSVEAFWGFDRNGRLIDVWVRKTTDAP